VQQQQQQGGDAVEQGDGDGASPRPEPPNHERCVALLLVAGAQLPRNRMLKAQRALVWTVVAASAALALAPDEADEAAVRLVLDERRVRDARSRRLLSVSAAGCSWGWWSRGRHKEMPDCLRSKWERFGGGIQAAKSASLPWPPAPLVGCGQSGSLIARQACDGALVRVCTHLLHLLTP
jgi:hypothetical protein